MVNCIYHLTREGPFSKDYPLRDQIRRAAISSMTNISEGFSRYHKKDFIRFLDISQSSTSEIKSLAFIALDQHYISNEQFQSIQELADETRKTTLGLLKHIKSTIETSANVVRESPVEYKTKSQSEFLELPEEFIYH